MSRPKRPRLDFTKPLNLTELGWELPNGEHGRIRPAKVPLEDQPRKPGTPEAPLDMSSEDEVEFYVRSVVFAERSRLIAPALVRRHTGRQRETTAPAVALVRWATIIYKSERRALRQLRDLNHWNRMRAATISAHPHSPDLHLPTSPPSRESYRGAWKRFAEDPERVADYLAMAERDAIGCYDEVIEASPGAVTNPAAGNVVIGDETWVKARTDFDPSTVGSRQDGTEYQHRGDPSARPMKGSPADTDDSGRAVRKVAFQIVSCRNRFGNERVILSVRPSNSGMSDATQFTDRVLELRDALVKMTAIAYDGAMHGVDADRLVAGGLVPMSKISLKNGKVDTFNLGPRTFRTQDGSLATRSVHTVNGAAALVFPAGGDQWCIPLALVQILKRKHTVYQRMRIPNEPQVPAPLRGATVDLRLNATEDERAAGINIAEHLKAFPEGSARFDDLYGLREDVESANSLLKSDLPGRRLRTANPTENLIDLTEWLVMRNNRARLARRQRLARETPEPLARTG